VVVEQHADGHWYRQCELCNQTVLNGSKGYGPWCDLYCGERRVFCYAFTKKRLHEADAMGDGPMVNALCAYGRKRWGEDIDW